MEKKGEKDAADVHKKWLIADNLQNFPELYDKSHAKYRDTRHKLDLCLEFDQRNNFKRKHK